MNRILITLVMLLPAIGFAQDNNDGATATHDLAVTVPELAIIDIYDNSTSLEAATKTFDLADLALDGTNKEAGTYQLEDVSISDLYLNYTSVVGTGGAPIDASRTIAVRMVTGSTFPGSLDLRVTPATAVITTDGGTAASAGTIIGSGVALGVTTAIGTDATIVTDIGSVYTGDGAFGVPITYTLEQNGNFAAFQAGSYTATLQYTISDL